MFLKTLRILQVALQVQMRGRLDRKIEAAVCTLRHAWVVGNFGASTGVNCGVNAWFGL